MRKIDENKVVEFFKSQDKKFVEACSRVNVKPSKRQASKWLMGKGLAFKEGR